MLSNWFLTDVFFHFVHQGSFVSCSGINDDRKWLHQLTRLHHKQLHPRAAFRWCHATVAWQEERDLWKHRKDLRISQPGLSEEGGTVWEFSISTGCLFPWTCKWLLLVDLCLGFVKSNDCYGNVIVMPKSSVKLKLKNFYNSSEQPVRNPTDPKTWSILRLALQVEIMDKVFEIRSKCCAENWQNKLNWAATSETSKQRPWKCESPILFVYGAHLDVSQHPLSKCNIYLYEVWAWNRGWLVESDYYLNCEAKF